VLNLQSGEFILYPLRHGKTRVWWDTQSSKPNLEKLECTKRDPFISSCCFPFFFIRILCSFLLCVSLVCVAVCLNCTRSVLISSCFLSHRILSHLFPVLGSLVLLTQLAHESRVLTLWFGNQKVRNKSFEFSVRFFFVSHSSALLFASIAPGSLVLLTQLAHESRVLTLWFGNQKVRLSCSLS
jgi:hypothetical protein